MFTAAIWLSFAFSLGLLMRLIGLPPLVGYLGAGFILSLNGHQSTDLLQEVAHAGVLLLLFSVGLKLRWKSLLRSEVLGGSLLHMLLTVLFTAALLTGFADLDLQTALLVALALSFSSTVVAAKVLESKRELRAFHGRVAIGILIMQDLVAVAVLSMAGGVSPSPWAFMLLGIFLLRPLLHWLLDVSGRGELVVLYGLLLALVVGGAGFEGFGLSSELGALLLGVILADHRRAKDLSSALWGVKELLLVGFFLQIGLSGHPSQETLLQAGWLLLLLPLKALLFFFVLLLFRLRARSSFLTGLALATYSEFGLIIASLGVRQGWMSEEWLMLLAVAVALSFTITAPLNRYAHEIYTPLARFLQRFETKRRHPDDEPISLGSSHIVVMGMGRVGSGAYDELVGLKQHVVGLDSDIGKVEQHLKAGRRVLYADAEDMGLWSKLNLDNVHAVLLALPETSAKLMAARQLRAMGFRGLISATIVSPEEQPPLTQAGVDQVYNYYDGVGNGLARVSLQHLNPPVLP
ncbi:MAG: cation:proton antiporter family protein [Gammaproteobacteria bacterium]|nr:cation:proton antiporter family protein [Gammaproteobacteria bacterium]